MQVPFLFTYVDKISNSTRNQSMIIDHCLVSTFLAKYYECQTDNLQWIMMNYSHLSKTVMLCSHYIKQKDMALKLIF